MFDVDRRGKSKNPTIKALIEIIVDNATKIRKHMFQFYFTKHNFLLPFFVISLFLLVIVSSRTRGFVNYEHFVVKVLWYLMRKKVF